jgi:hypothetical protein
MKDTDELIWNIFAKLLDKSEVNGKLTEDQIIALYGVCRGEIVAELERAGRFLNTLPYKIHLANFYESERDRSAIDGCFELTEKPVLVSIGQLTYIPFTLEMWALVENVRAVAHFMKLDILANHYQEHWGNPIDSARSIDAEVNASTAEQIPRFDPVKRDIFPKGTPHDFTGRRLMPCDNCGRTTPRDFYSAIIGMWGGLSLPIPFIKKSTAGKVGKRSHWSFCAICGEIDPIDAAA